MYKYKVTIVYYSPPSPDRAPFHVCMAIMHYYSLLLLHKGMINNFHTKSGYFYTAV